jgi:Holliday junction resolvasome RuvABC DNA-binding subunit
MKTALSRLAISLLSLLTVIVALATSLLKLVVTLVGLATAPLERLTSKWRQDGQKKLQAPQEPIQESQQGRPNLRVVSNMNKEGELTWALIGLGFKKGPVDRFVTSLKAEDLQLDIKDLIKKGLVALAPAALGGKS